jgi:hypothetical protein
MRADFERRQEGNVTVYVTVGLLGMFALMALATETGRVMEARSSLQTATDSAALAATGALLTTNFTVVDTVAADAAAKSYGAQHGVEGSALSYRSADIVPGSWDQSTNLFTPQPGVTDPNIVRAVRVTGRRDAALNGPLPAIFGRVVGVNDFNVQSTATGYIGWAGSGGPGTVDLPIAIDCCAIAGSTCSNNYCSTIQSSPPNPCPRTSDGVMVTCLEFFATGNQNACWTEFNPSSSSVSSSGLQGVVQNGNPGTIGDVPIYLDNGTKTPIVREISDKFYGQGAYSGNPAGTDTNGDGVSDSWVLGFPTVTCQNPSPHCAGGTTADINGFVCFDLQEVETTPGKIIRGQFLCPTDSRCAGVASGLGPGGTVVGGLSAQWPVLVE